MATIPIPPIASWIIAEVVNAPPTWSALNKPDPNPSPTPYTAISKAAIITVLPFSLYADANPTAKTMKIMPIIIHQAEVRLLTGLTDAPRELIVSVTWL